MAVRTAMEHPIGALPRTPFPASRDFAPVGSMSLDFQVASLSYKSSFFATSRGNEKIGGTGYYVTYDTDSQSRNVLASPLGEEGHEVAKGCTRVRMIMILDVDVTAERRHYNTHRPIGRYHNPRPERPSNLRTLRPSGRSILRTSPSEPFEPYEPYEPSRRRRVQGPSILRTFPFATLLHNPRRQPPPQPSRRRRVKLTNLKNPRGKAPSTLAPKACQIPLNPLPLYHIICTRAMDEALFSCKEILIFLPY